jgi:citrate lyase subunit beta/citryl-CoA lyase
VQSHRLSIVSVAENERSVRMNGKELFPRMRSMLLSPGNLPVSRKLSRFEADLKVVDLEDGVPTSEKESGRAYVVDTVTHLRRDGLAGALFVRVNAPGSSWLAEDLRAILQIDIDGLVVPMLRSPNEVREIELSVLALGKRLPIMWGIETGWAVERIGEILDSSELGVAVYFGSEDFATDVGMTRTASNHELAYARSRVALAAANRGLHAADKGVTDVRNEDEFVADALAGKQYGYTGKICVNPTQALLANTTFMPTAEEIEHSQRLLAEYAKALADGHSAPKIDGHMVDGPLVLRAQKMLIAAGLIDTSTLEPGGDRTPAP